MADEGISPNLFLNEKYVQADTLEPFVVPDLHPRSQERPPKSGSVPDGCQI